MRIQQLLILILAFSISQTASAHTGFHSVEGWLSGFVHPLMGLDHLLAMLGVGLWAVCIATDRRQIGMMPLVFMAFMIVGGILGSLALPLESLELGIAASVVVLGLMITGMTRLPKALAFALISLFALFHGYSHGTEMGQNTDCLSYAMGFLTATGLLHLTGIYLGNWLLANNLVYRTTGVVMGGIGLYLLTQAL